MKRVFPKLKFTVVFLTLFLIDCCKPLKAQLEINMQNVPVDISDVKKIGNNENVYIKIINVNKDLYDVTINGTKISYNTDVPSLLSLASIALPSAIPLQKKEAPLPFIQIQTAGISGDTTTAPLNCFNYLVANKNDIADQLKIFKEAVDTINAAIKYYNYLSVLQKSCKPTEDIIAQKKTAAKKIFNGTDSSSIRSFFDSRYNQIVISYNKIQIALNNIDSLNHYNDCSATDKKKIDLYKFTDREKDLFVNVDKTYQQITDMIMNDEALLIINRFVSINESNFTVISEIIKAKQADKIQFTVSIKPKNWVPCEAVEKNFKVTYKVKGGIKVDFSSGIFGNFGNANFHGNSYFLDSLYVIRNLNTSSKSLIPSIGGLLHIYYRTGGDINAGIAGGASITTDLKITNFHAGVSLMCNVDNEILNRLALTGGLTWRYVKDLNANYTVGTPVDKNLTIDQLETGKYKQGWFVALTWNLTKKDK